MRDRAAGVDDSDYPGTEMRKIDISHLTRAPLHQMANLLHREPTTSFGSNPHSTISP